MFPSRSDQDTNHPREHFQRSCLVGTVLLAFEMASCSSQGLDPTGIRDRSARLPGGETTNTLLTGVNSYNQPVANITVKHEGFFFSGNSFFTNPWVQAPSSTKSRDGLGPLFNARSCSACHFKDGRGRPPLDEDDDALGLLLRLSNGYDDSQKPVPDPQYGGQFQPFAIAGVPPEGAVTVEWIDRTFEYPDGSTIVLSEPKYVLTDLAYGALDPATVVSPRIAPAVIGMGLLEAIPLSRLEDLADPNDDNGDGISGRVRLVYDKGQGAWIAGRFGWKADQPTVRQQAAGAFLGDIGITSELFSEQNCSPVQTECQEALSGGDPEIETTLLDRVELYTQLLAVPASRAFENKTVTKGAALFSRIGCADCHTEFHHTGQHPQLSEVSDQDIWPYTDLLLHNMGPQLSDSHRHELDAEWRTPPLWGLGLMEDVNDHQRLLHDGRADGVEAAILWHGGEAEASRYEFENLSEDERLAVIEFVNSL